MVQKDAGLGLAIAWSWISRSVWPLLLAALCTLFGVLAFKSGGTEPTIVVLFLLFFLLLILSLIFHHTLREP